MATNSPPRSSVDSPPDETSRSRTPLTAPSPRISVTTESQRKSILGFLKARSCMILDARSSLRRWITVTDEANLVRNSASSMAESPPPTTPMGRSRKKKPSQVAHVDTPRPSSRCSAGSPSMRARAPVAMINERPSKVGSPVAPSVHTEKGRVERCTRDTFLVTSSAPNRAAWARNVPIRSGPMIASTNPG